MMYEVYIAGFMRTASAGGPVDAVGQRRAVFIEVSDLLEVVRHHGLHGLVVPVGNDDGATYIVIPRGQHAGAWDEAPAVRERPQQAEANR